MSTNGNHPNGSTGAIAPAPESTERAGARATELPEPIYQNSKENPVVPRFATRMGRAADGMSKGKLILLGGGLLAAMLFFVFTATVSKSPKKQPVSKTTSQQARQESP